MAQASMAFDREVAVNGDRDTTVRDVSYQAFRILQVGFVVAPIVAGLDKFFHLLVDWNKYLPPVVNNLVGGHGHQFMMVVGVVEMVAGLGVAIKPKYFAYVVAA